MSKPQVLVVDDEPGILRLLDLEFSSQGFSFRLASNAEDALHKARETWPDVVVADILMPGMDGLELMRRLRSAGNLKVILLTAKSREADRVHGLELGADDYVSKPFSPRELSARIRAVLRRTQNAAVPLRIGDLVIDIEGHLVRRAGRDIALTRTEWRLLEEMVEHANRVVLNNELLSRVWSQEYRSDLQYLRGWISSLRKKLEVNPAEPQLIRTRIGVGYMLDTGGT